MLVTGEPGSGRNYYNEAEAEKYVIKYGKNVYSFPFQGFEVKSAKSFELHKIVTTRKIGIHQVEVEDTYDKVEMINKYVPKFKKSLMIIPACPAYAELIQVALAHRNDKDNDIILIRDTIKDFAKITNVIPDCFRIHADNTLAIQSVYANELSMQIGANNAISFLIAQWVVNEQFKINQKAEEEFYRFGYYLYLQNGKIVTVNDPPDPVKTESLRQIILEEGSKILKTRFGVEMSDEDLRNEILNFLD